MSAHRLRWEELPRHVRAEIESTLGARVIASTSGSGGYSPSFASVCELVDGRRVFVKAVSPTQNPESPGMLRREIEITRALPPSVPAPRLLNGLDDGEWIVGIFEYLEGRPPRVPWARAEFDATVDTVVRVSTTRIDNPFTLAALSSADVLLERDFGRWSLMATHPPAGLDAWAFAHRHDLAALESSWRDAVRGDVLVHLDVRSDNLIVVNDGTVMLVDWPHACVGAPGLDLLVMLPSVILEGGIDAEEVVRNVPPTGACAPHAIDVILAALTGCWLHQGSKPDPPGLPTVRAFQRAQGTAGLRWLRTRLGDPARQ